jgi:stage III sporulation protein AC
MQNSGGFCMNYEIILKIAAIGILTAVISQVRKNVNKDDIATVATLSGVVIVLIMVVQLIAELFDTVKNLFLIY